MKLIVGLGNPGAQYERTRHNAGFMAVDLLADRHAKGGIARSRFSSATLEVQMPGASAPEKCLLMKPTTYMNRSGLAVAEAVRFFKLDPVVDVLVLVDDVYLPCGTIRLRESGAAGGHNGLGDIERLLGSDRYPRCRIGVDAPGIVPQADYVLGRFSEAQWPLVKEALVKAADASELFVRSGINAAMNKFNGKAAEHQQRRAERPPASQPGTSAATSTPTASSTASSTPGPSASPTASPTPNPS